MSDLESKYYVIIEGRKIGICKGWKICKPLVVGYYGAKFEDFEFEDVAYKFAFNLEIETGRDYSREIVPSEDDKEVDSFLGNTKTVNPHPKVFVCSWGTFALEKNGDRSVLSELATAPSIPIGNDEYHSIVYISCARVNDDSFRYHTHRLMYGNHRFSMSHGIAPDYKSAMLAAMTYHFVDGCRPIITDRVKTLKIVGLCDSDVISMLNCDETLDTYEGQCKKHLIAALNCNWTIKYSGEKDAWSSYDRDEVSFSMRMARSPQEEC